MDNHQDCCRTVGDVLAHTVVTALEEKEAQLDEELHKLDNLQEDDLEVLRQKRLDQLRKNSKRNQELIALGHGEYTEVGSEKEFFDIVKKSKHVVCHFYRPSTWRCAILDKHLSSLANRHVECKFIKVNAEKSPFLTERLRIVMLPTLTLITDGKTEHSIIGFDELGGKDDFETEDLETLLVTWGIIHRS
jgi:hypothetical protein